jgi:hypothetical protein
MYNFEEDGEGLFGIDDYLGLLIAEKMSSISTQSHPDHKEDIFNNFKSLKGLPPEIRSSHPNVRWLGGLHR